MTKNNQTITDQTAPQAKNRRPSTRQYLPIAEIRNDTVIMKDGTLRSVLLVSSLNFALKSADEQQAIISGYMSFLNSLNWPIQIVVQSRKFNVDDYLNRLSQAEREQTNELLKTQIRDYRKFINDLVEVGDIMTKKFYVVVPYNPLSDKQQGFWTRLVDLFTPSSFIRLKEDRFNQRREELTNRVRHIMSGLSSIGLAAQILPTQALIELYYNSYNPELADSEKIVDVDMLQVNNG